MRQSIAGYALVAVAALSLAAFFRAPSPAQVAGPAVANQVGRYQVSVGGGNTPGYVAILDTATGQGWVRSVEGGPSWRPLNPPVGGAAGHDTKPGKPN
jgi:hypothetical protein